MNKSITEQDQPQSSMRSGHAQNRSLERGIEILRAFRQGVDHLGNGEIAERTGLSKATVSRLTQTLVAGGLLEHLAGLRAYRLAPTVLSLAHAMRLGSPLLRAGTPLIRDAAERLRVNVGLAAADRDTMIYLEAVRTNRKSSLRNVTAGQRVPIELTSLGRAYLAALSKSERETVLDRISIGRANWPRLLREIDAAITSVARRGYCASAWQPGVAAVSVPISMPDGGIYALNMSVATESPLSDVVRQLRRPLFDLRDSLLDAVSA
jgi:DNA-binding IclR family transcriptional regulator